MKKALIAGASGLVGSDLLELLLESGQTGEIHLLLRRPLGLSHQNVSEHLVDFDRLEETAIDLAGADVFCTLGTTIRKAGSQENFKKVDYDYVVKLAMLARDHKARGFYVITSLGANPRSRVFYNRVKGEVEEELQRLGLPKLHIFRPSLLHGPRREFRLGERAGYLLSKLITPFLFGNLRKYRPIASRQVARAMIHSATTDNAAFRILESDEIAAVA